MRTRRLVRALTETRIQRWVGVQYHPETEVRSHYGEMRLTRCYDTVVFVDRTTALVPPDKQRGRALVSACTTCAKRLMKECRRLQQRPVAGVRAYPLDENILEWHFLLTCSQSPYEGGEYHGVLEFTPEYPMKPPSIKMLTPSGRFLTSRRLCLSISDYHPESWNPSWSVGAVIVGLQSFMYEESNAIGSIRASKSERAELAASSAAFNRRNAIYRELFLDEDEDDGVAASGSSKRRRRGRDDVGEGEEEPISESVCRFCFGSEGELISPCMCTDFVHLECLRKWQKSVLLSQSTHPKYQTSIDRICNVCLEPFSGIGEAPSRHEQILQYTGEQIVNMVREGNLLVSTRESSRENLDLMKKHPEIRKNLMHWTKAVYLMINARSGLVALGTTLKIVAPKHWDTYVRTVVCSEDGVGVDGSFRCVHYDGGPVQPRKAIAVMHVPEYDNLLRVRRELRAKGDPKAKEYDCLVDLQRVRPDVLFGSFETAAAVAVVRYRERDVASLLSSSSKSPSVINVVWGVAAWGETQILAEIARGGWGIVEMKDYVAIRPDVSMDVDWDLDFDWSRVVGLAKTAPKTEYTRKGRRG
eukprot:g5335.t1